MLSKKGMEEIITSPLLNNIVAIDEFYSGLHGTHDRQDIMMYFIILNLNNMLLMMIM